MRPSPSARHIAATLRAASPRDIDDGVDWYQRAEAFAGYLAAAYGCSTVQAAGVLAALSPNNRWSRNCHDAERMVAAWRRGDDFAAVTVSTYGANRDKAASVLRMVDPAADDVAAILRGPKITAFFWSILGQHDAVCVDSHAYSIATGQRLVVAKVPTVRGKLYADVAAAYRRAARHSHRICGRRLTPAQVQAVTWVAYRRQHQIADRTEQ
jgi:hypothetical protein